MTYAAGTDDADLQRKGIVGLIWCQDFKTSYKFKETPKHCRMQVHEFSAIRVSAMHICASDAPFFGYCRVMWAIGMEGRARLKIHVGAYQYIPVVVAIWLSS